MTGVQLVLNGEETVDNVDVPPGRTFPEGLSIPRDDRHSIAESIISRSLPSSISSSRSDSVQHDGKGVGKWMSTWWIKDKPRKERPSLIISPTTNNTVFPSLEPRTPAKSSLHPGLAETDPSSTVKPEKSSRRKVSRSVFGSLGFSIMNPTISSSSKKPVPRSLAEVKDDIFSPPEELVQEDTPSKVSSPTHNAMQLPSGPIPPQLTTTMSFEDVGVVDPPPQESMPQPDDWPPPQGSSLQAIVNATRVMTDSRASILVEQCRDSGELIAQLSMDLVRNARDANLSSREKLKDKKPQRTDIAEEPSHAAVQGVITPPGSTDAKATLNKTLATPTKHRTYRSPSSAPYFSGTLFAPFIAEQQRRISNAVAGIVPSKKALESQSPQASDSHRTEQSTSGQKPRSVPLDSIIPDDAKPPTQYLARRYVSLTAKDFKPIMHISTTAARHSVIQKDVGPEPLTDRYGFIYDVSKYDSLLLGRAIDCQNAAPACLTGVRIADRDEEAGWSDDEETADKSFDVVAGDCECEVDKDWSKVEKPSGTDESSIRTPLSPTVPDGSPPPSLLRRPSTIASRKRSPTVSSVVAPSIKSLAAVLSVESDSPRHTCEKSIRRMLHSLSEIHNQQQDTRKKVWDTFLKQRSKVKPRNQQAATGNPQGGGAAAILGLGTSVEEEELLHSEGMIGFSQMGHSLNREEKKEFTRLIHDGVPLDYRSKVWLECSGALDMMEPGVYNDLLNSPSAENDSVLREIEKDVGRTMPLNIFFGGDGPGVDKLRRVLTAYSRSVPLLQKF